MNKRIIGGISLLAFLAIGGFFIGHGDTYYQAWSINDKGTNYEEAEDFTIPAPPNEPPSIAVISPVTGLTVTKGEAVNISAQADDDQQVTLMSVYVNDEVKNEVEDNSINFDWDTGSINTGQHVIKVTASDGEETREEFINITVAEAVLQVADTAAPDPRPALTDNTQVSRSYTPVAASKKYPMLSKVNGAFGQFPYRDIAGGRIEIDPEWVKQNIVTITLPGLNRQVEVHKDAADNFIMAFNYIKNGTTVVDGKEVPLLSLIYTMDGTFVPRHVHWDANRGLSNHSWGTAIDINAAGHLRYVDPVKEPNNPNLILWEKAFKPAGFSWGNSYADAMHYEIFK